jgi:hypothetical protein
MKTSDEAPKLPLMTPHVSIRRGLGRLCSNNPTHKYFNVMQRTVLLFTVVVSFYGPRLVMGLIKKMIDHSRAQRKTQI